MANTPFTYGSCAYRAEASHGNAVIIKFPERTRKTEPRAKRTINSLVARINRSEMVYSLRNEPSKGTSIECIPFWQTVVASVASTVVGAFMIFLFL